MRTHVFSTQSMLKTCSKKTRNCSNYFFLHSRSNSSRADKSKLTKGGQKLILVAAVSKYVARNLISYSFDFISKSIIISIIKLLNTNWLTKFDMEGTECKTELN